MKKKSPQSRSIINQAEVVRRMGISPSYLSLLLSGKRKNAKRRAEIREVIQKELEKINGP